MKYLIIFLIVCMVLGPVMMLQLSPAQRRKANLRNKAVALGMVVQYSDMPGQKVRPGRATEKGISYSIRCADLTGNKKKELFVWCLLRGDSDTQWCWREPDGAPEIACQNMLSEKAAELPVVVRAMEYRNNQLTIYWKEQGTEQDVEQIYAVMVAVKDCLANG